MTSNLQPAMAFKSLKWGNILTSMGHWVKLMKMTPINTKYSRLDKESME